jgi:transposase
VPEDRHGPTVKWFRAETHGLDDMVGFPRLHGIEHVAMEATGCYRIPVLNRLEAAGFDVALLNPRALKGIPGKKTDVKDGRWIRDVYAHGFGQKSFVPVKVMAPLRELVRLRGALVQDRARHINRMIKSLRMMNINLEKAVSDVTGKTGLAIIDSILAGERNPLVLAALRDVRCKKSETEIARYLDGVFTTHHLHILRIERHSYDTISTQIDLTDEVIEKELDKIMEAVSRDTDPDSDGGDGGAAGGPAMDMERAEKLRLITGSDVELTRIEGIGPGLALTIISEIGADMGRWPTVKRFTSWLGLCPGRDISGDKVLSAATRKVASRAAWAFRMAANSVRRSRSARATCSGG